MNLLHLKYAVEVEKTRSIDKAAENLFMGQPNLSRAIKELEESLGITIFNRTSKGISPTEQGEEFLSYAKSILSQVSNVEAMYRENKHNIKHFSISVPRASYITQAFTDFVNKINNTTNFELSFKETNSMRAINNILHSDYNLGIIRYQTKFERSFSNLKTEKGLKLQKIFEFSSVVVMSAENPLANKESLMMSDLQDYIEIAHKDYYVPSVSLMDLKKEELSESINKRVFVFERGSQFDLLCGAKNTFMFVSPIPQKTLDRYGLVQKICKDYDKDYRDVLIYKKNYQFSELDKLFLSEIEGVVKTLH